jgi:hypothetical protein
MRYTGLVALLSLASTIVAQTPPAIPQCLLTCTKTSCPVLTDLQCICITHINDITTCALASCSQADLTTAASLASAQCGMCILYVIDF